MRARVIMAIGAVALAFALGAWCGSAADAVVVASPPRASGAVPSAGAGAGPGAEGGSLETAAAKAGNTGRTVAMSLIGLALAVSATVLAFKRDFKEAAGVFAVGVVAVLLATPAGVALLRDTVSSLFGGP